MLGVFISISLFAVLLVFVAMDKSPAAMVEVGWEVQRKLVLKSVRETLTHMTRTKQCLITVITVYNGLVQAVFVVEWTLVSHIIS